MRHLLAGATLRYGKKKETEKKSGKERTSVLSLLFSGVFWRQGTWAGVKSLIAACVGCTINWSQSAVTGGRAQYPRFSSANDSNDFPCYLDVV